MTDAVFHPDFRAEPYWYDLNAAYRGSDDLPSRVNVAIVGGGYCGLAAALDLARAGLSACVLEADAFGIGASSRNVGFVSPVQKLILRYQGTRPDLVKACIKSFTVIEELIEQEGLDIDYRRSGRLLLAHTRGAHEGLRRQADRLAAAGLGVRLLEPAEAHVMVGSAEFAGALHIAEAGELDPAKFHKALCEAASRAGATLCSHAEVQSITGREGGFRIETPRGTIKADKVFVATNGTAGKALPWLRRRIIPFTSQVIATEPLDEATVKGVMGAAIPWGDTRRAPTFARLSPDRRRILLAGRAKFGSSSERETAAIHHRTMSRIWPELASVRLTHSWHGTIALTFDQQPHMGAHEGIHYAAGCQGAGVAMMTYLGRETARKLLGAEARSLPFESFPFPTLPLYGGRPWFIPAVGAYYRLRDRADQWLDGRARTGL